MTRKLRSHAKKEKEKQENDNPDTTTPGINSGATGAADDVEKMTQSLKISSNDIDSVNSGEFPIILYEW